MKAFLSLWPLRRLFRNLRKGVPVLALGLALAGGLEAGFFEILGGQKVGTTAFAFLKIGVGARAVALGEAYVSRATDATAPYWNPAGTGFLEHAVAGVSHAFWPAEVQYTYAAWATRLGSASAVGIFVGSLGTDAMRVTDEYHPGGTGEYFRYADYLAGVNYALRVSDRFAFGANLKVLGEDLYVTRTYGVALDLGTLYDVGYRGIQVGVALSNIGPDVRPRARNGATYEAFALPVVYRMGVSGYAWRSLLVALQLEKPSDYMETFRLGAEYRVADVLFLRAGYQLNGRGPGRTGLPSGLSLGFGLRWTLRGHRIAFDYARSGLGYLGDVDRITLEVQ